MNHTVSSIAAAAKYFYVIDKVGFSHWDKGRE
jgi:hypothetical protein